MTTGWRTMWVWGLMAGLGGMAPAVPVQMDYQGKLTDPTGNPVNGVTTMVFRIFTHATSGSLVWIETQELVSVENGLFNVSLGSVMPISESLFNTDPRYLSVQVGSDPLMTPRIPLQSVPYALRALSAETADTATVALGPWGTSGGNVYRSIGNVGIGITSPSAPLHVYRSSGAAQAKIQSASGDADLILDNTSGNPTVEFQRNSVYGGGVGYDPVNNYMFLYHNGSLVFKNNRLGIGTNNPSTSLEVNGSVKVTGQCQGTFPRPNYDSGWVYLDIDNGNQDGAAILTHGLGGDVDDYVVDIVSKDTQTMGINNLGIGTYPAAGDGRGFYFRNLTTTTISIIRESQDYSSEYVRVRIWVYN